MASLVKHLLTQMMQKRYKTIAITEDFEVSGDGAEFIKVGADGLEGGDFDQEMVATTNVHPVHLATYVYNFADLMVLNTRTFGAEGAAWKKVNKKYPSSTKILANFLESANATTLIEALNFVAKKLGLTIPKEVVFVIPEQAEEVDTERDEEVPETPEETAHASLSNKPRAIGTTMNLDREDEASTEAEVLSYPEEETPESIRELIASTGEDDEEDLEVKQDQTIEGKEKTDLQAEIKRVLKEQGIAYGGMDLLDLFSRDSEQKTIDLIIAVNQGVDNYIKLNPTKSLPHLPDDDEFRLNLETSLSKISIIYQLWILKLQMDLTSTRRTTHKISYALAAAARQMSTAVANRDKDTLKWYRDIFGEFRSEIKQRILSSPDKTGLLQVLRPMQESKISSLLHSLYEADEPKKKGMPRLTDYSAINSAGDKHDVDVLDISSSATLRAVLRGIIYNLLLPKVPDFVGFETEIPKRFFGKQDEASLIHRISRVTSADQDAEDFGDAGVASNIPMAAGSPEDLLLPGDAQKSANQVASDTLGSVLDSLPNPTKAKHLAEVTSTGIKLFKELDNGNFCAILFYLLENVYRGKKDLVTIPATSGIFDEATQISLFSWLTRLTTEGRTGAKETYVLKAAFIDFVNAFADVMKKASGSSLPLTEEQIKVLRGNITAFAEKYKIDTLRLKLTDVEAAQKKQDVAIAKSGATFISGLMTIVSDGVELDDLKKRGLIEDLKLLDNISNPTDLYFDTFKVLYKRYRDAEVLIKKIALTVLGLKRTPDTNDDTRKQVEIIEILNRDIRDLLSTRSKFSFLLAPKITDISTKFKVALPTKSDLPPEIALIVSPLSELEEVLANFKEIPLSNGPQKLSHDKLEAKLMQLINAKKSGVIESVVQEHRNLSEAKTLSKGQVLDMFITECLPVMDSLLIDARQLVNYLRHVVHDENPYLLFPETDKEIQEMPEEDFEAKVVNSLRDPKRLWARRIRSFVEGYLYTVNQATTTGNNAPLIRHIFTSEFPAYIKLFDRMKSIVINKLLPDPDFGDEASQLKLKEFASVLQNMINSIAGKDGVDSRGGEVIDFDALDDFLEDYDSRLLREMTSRSGDQSASQKLFTQLLSNHTTGKAIPLASPRSKNSFRSVTRREAKTDRELNIPVTRDAETFLGAEDPENQDRLTQLANRNSGNF